MALLIILTLMGATYTLLTRSPRPVRQFELTAVWSTLGFIALALLSDVAPAIGLAVAAALAAPLWFLTISVSGQYAATQTQETGALWRRWKATTGGRASSTEDVRAEDGRLEDGRIEDGRTEDVQPKRPPLAVLLYQQDGGEVVREIGGVQTPNAQHDRNFPVLVPELELTPLEHRMPWRRQV